MSTLIQGLRVLAADEDHGALARTCAMLEDLGHQVTATAVDLAEVTEAVARFDPQLSVVVVHSDDEHALDLIGEIAAFAGGPIIALVHGEDVEFIREAAERGVGATVRHGDEAGLRDAIEVATRRHAETAALSDQIGRLETAIERRATIERAKGMLMERHGLSERGAFDRMRAFARAHNRTVVEVAGDVAAGRIRLPD